MAVELLYVNRLACLEPATVISATRATRTIAIDLLACELCPACGGLLWPIGCKWRCRACGFAYTCSDV